MGHIIYKEEIHEKKQEGPDIWIVPIQFWVINTCNKCDANDVSVVLRFGEGKEELNVTVSVINEKDYKSLTIPSKQHVVQDIQMAGDGPHRIHGYETISANFSNCK